MLRLVWMGSLWLGAGALGCGGGADSGGAGCTGGTVTFEPGNTCTAFCALAVGECEATELGDDDACKQNCEQERCFAELTSEACLTAFEGAVDCAAELDCQDVDDQINGVNPDSYPCLPELEISNQICTQL